MIAVAFNFFAWLFCLSATGLAFSRNHWRWWCVWAALTAVLTVTLFFALGAPGFRDEA